MRSSACCGRRTIRTVERVVIGRRFHALGFGLAALALSAGCRGAADDRRASDAPDAVRESTPAESAGARPDAAWMVDFRGYGPIRFGASFDDARSAAAGMLETPASMTGCQYVRISGGRAGVLLMVVDGRVARVDVLDQGVETREGARVGDAEGHIRELYPHDLEVRAHKYTSGNVLIVTPAEGGPYRLVFETEQDEVRRYRSGVLPEVEWVEGCG